MPLDLGGQLEIPLQAPLPQGVQVVETDVLREVQFQELGLHFSLADAADPETPALEPLQGHLVAGHHRFRLLGAAGAEGQGPARGRRGIQPQPEGLLPGQDGIPEPDHLIGTHALLRGASR